MGILSRLFSRPAKVEPAPQASPAPPVVALTPQEEKPKPKGVTYKVAGVTQYKDNIMSLAVRSTEYTLGKRDLIE